MKGNTIKILIAGSRYTGKGQVGRAWGKTDADLPALQPVILYDRHVIHDGTQHRVVAWVLSYDPEFEDLRASFFKGADGIVFTYNITEDPPTSLEHLDAYSDELHRVLRHNPPSVLVGVCLDAEDDISLPSRERGIAWAGEHNIPMVEANFMDKQQFAGAVDRAFAVVIDAVFVAAKKDQTRPREGKLF